MKKNLLGISTVVMLFAGLASANVETAHLPDEWGNELAYRISVPDDYASRNDWPVWLYFHGHGGQGTNGAPMPAGSLWKEKVVVIAPQCGPTTSQNWWQSTKLNAARAVFDYEMTQLNTDPDRVLVAGQSMGGYGSYLFTELYPGVPAAVAPICGGWFWGYKSGPFPDDMSPWDHLPYWHFHGKNDTTVNLWVGNDTVASMREDGIHTKYTVYQNKGHNIKTNAYNSQTFWDWVLSQERGTSHNYELAVDGGSGTSVFGFFEPATGHSITGRAPDAAAGEVFRGWTSENGLFYEDAGGARVNTTFPTDDAGSFADANAITTTFTMGAGDVIVTANYLQALANQPVSDITATSAMANANLDATDSNFDVTVYWGTADGGTDPDAWGDDAFVGSWTDTSMSISHELSLLPGTDYYYTFRATNGSEDIWGGTSAGFAPVPEPATLALLAMGSIVLLRRDPLRAGRNM